MQIFDLTGYSDRDTLYCGRAARKEVNFHRGVRRLGIGLVLLWLVFWTSAYIIKPPVSEKSTSVPPAFSLMTDIAVIAAAALGTPWIVSGFRPHSGTTRG